ncbi:TolC family protein [Sulfurimonas sp.]|uniref:TolC family protein n=1 Tax=Sulfurimonas sp. TaxID=2022749 RepID=UPI0025E73A38|nr:TolC family protein [Sulfurimonas sp.]MDD5156747.1 TolC family protein [Sulfurimonas sp.]
MKVLKPLIALLVLYSTQIFAQEKYDNLENYLSKDKQDYYKLEREKTKSSSDKLRNSWISPVMLNYNYGVSGAYDADTVTKKTSITIDQPIFQSGGIYFGIKFAEASRTYSKYSVDVAKRKLIKDAISLLMQIKQSDMNIKKQQLLIKNSEISLAQKKEDYLNGQLDSGFLNSAIIDRNVVIQALFDIEASKERAVSKFCTISDLSYQDAILPHLELISEDKFLANNISYKLSKSLTEKNRYAKNITTSKYLPSINVYGGYNWDKIENLNFGGVTMGGGSTDYANYGFKISMPLNINSSDDIQTAKLEYLESKILETDKKRELSAMFEQVMQNIESFQKKKQLSIENIDMYSELLLDTKELYKAGYKTQYDVEILENSVEIARLNSMIFDLDKQLELLSLYEMYTDEV